MTTPDPAALIAGLERLATVADRKAVVIETRYGPLDFDACELRDDAALLRLTIAALSNWRWRPMGALPEMTAAILRLENGATVTGIQDYEGFWNESCDDGQGMSTLTSKPVAHIPLSALPPLPEPALSPAQGDDHG